MKWSQVDIRSTANKMTNLNVFLTHDLVKKKKKNNIKTEIIENDQSIKQTKYLSTPQG